MATSMALPQFNQGFNNPGWPNQQQRFPNIIGNQNPFLPGNPGIGFVEEFNNNNQQGFGGPQIGFGNQQQQPFVGQQSGFGGQQELNNNNNNQQQGSSGNQQQSTTAAPVASSSSVVGTPQFVLCNQNCPSVNQYNPICGTDQVTYNNQYRLDCANECGRQLDSNWQGK